MATTPVVKVDKKTSLKKHFHRTDDATFEAFDPTVPSVV